MASGNLNYADLARRMTSEGSLLELIDMVSGLNPLFGDLVWREGRYIDGDGFGRKVQNPTVYPRAFNQGVDASKTKTVPVKEQAGMFTGYSRVDTSEANVGGNPAALRAEEDDGFVEAFSSTMESQFFYGNNITDKRTFTGLAPRYASLTSGETAKYVIDGETDSASGDQNRTSIWGVVHHDRGVHAFTPKGLPGGLKHTDLGIQMTTDEAGKQYDAYTSKWEIICGLSVRDFRCASRIANLHTESLLSEANGISVWKNLATMRSRLRRAQSVKPGGRVTVYMHETVFEILNKQAIDGVEGALLTFKDFGDGLEVPMLFGSMPIRITDGLILGESKLT